MTHPTYTILLDKLGPFTWTWRVQLQKTLLERPSTIAEGRCPRRRCARRHAEDAAELHAGRGLRWREVIWQATEAELSGQD